MELYRSSTTSLRSSMYETVEENGRTYHKYIRLSYHVTILLTNYQVQGRE